MLVQLGEAHLEASLEEAERRATDAFALAQRHGERGNEAWAVHLLSRVASARPSTHHDTALAHATRALSLAQDLGMRPLIAHCHRGLGQIQRGAGRRPEQAHEHLATAATMYREMAMSHWLEPAPAAGV